MIGAVLLLLAVTMLGRAQERSIVTLTPSLPHDPVLTPLTGTPGQKMDALDWQVADIQRFTPYIYSIRQTKIKLVSLLHPAAGGEMAYLKPGGQSWVSSRLARLCGAGRVRRNMHAVVYHNSEKAMRYLNSCLVRVGQ